MPFIIECDNCGYSRSSDADGRMFHEVCAICYNDSCPTLIGDVVICNECFIDEQDAPLIIDPGESLFT